MRTNVYDRVQVSVAWASSYPASSSAIFKTMALAIQLNTCNTLSQTIVAMSQSVAANNEFVLFGCMPKEHAADCLQAGYVTAFGQQTHSYIGLRENAQEAFQRMVHFVRNPRGQDYHIFRVCLTPRGMLHVTTQMVDVAGTPLLFKKKYKDGRDWGVWHFMGDIPVELKDSSSGDLLVSVTFHPLS